MSVIFSDRDAARTFAAVVAHENRVIADDVQTETPRQFFQVAPLKMFKLLASAAAPASLNDPTSVDAQPFEGETVPRLVFQDERNDDGELVPITETIYHTIPGLRLCPGTIVWAVYAYGAWRIIHAEQWPVMVQQIAAEGFPDGSVGCSLTIDGTAYSFSLSTHATAAELLAAVRDHPRITDPGQVRAVGGPLTYCDINLMFGPALTGKAIEPITISNLGQAPGRGLRVRILTPTWAE